MDENVKSHLDEGFKSIHDALAAKLQEHTAQVEKFGKAETALTGKIDELSEQYKSMKDDLTDVMQKGLAHKGEEAAIWTPGNEFVGSQAYKDFAAEGSQNGRARIQVKNTVTAGSTTVLPTQMQGVIPGDFAPVTIRQRIPTITVANNAVNSLREASWTNDAAETAQGTSKPESDVTFEQYNVAVETVAHWIKVSNQLLADAPAIAAYIDTRLRDGLAQRIDRQLLLGNGTTPQLSGLTDGGNFTAYTATSGDNLVQAVNRAKYLLWAKGHMADTVIVNPADWSAQEIEREASGGMFLYGAPGTSGGTSPFGVQIVMSNWMPAGSFLIGNLAGSTMAYQRQGAVVEMGYINDDFTKNLVTVRCEERLGLAVDRPSGLYYGDITAT